MAHGRGMNFTVGLLRDLRTAMVWARPEGVPPNLKPIVAQKPETEAGQVALVFPDEELPPAKTADEIASDDRVELIAEQVLDATVDHYDQYWLMKDFASASSRAAAGRKMRPDLCWRILFLGYDYPGSPYPWILYVMQPQGDEVADMWAM